MTETPLNVRIPVLSVDDFQLEIERVLEQGSTWVGRCEAWRFLDHYRQQYEEFQEGIRSFRGIGIGPADRAWALAKYRAELLETIKERKDDPGPSMNTEATTSSTDLPPQPIGVALGEMLLVLFCPRNRARHVTGDLEEIFHNDVKRKGQRRANLLYWSAILRSVGPLLWVKLRKAGFIALVLEIGRRWSGMS
jgi:hypothetical protein